jgi:hypothetical protein
LGVVGGAEGGLDKKKQRRKPEGLRHFLDPIYSLYQPEQGKCVTFPDFIFRMNPTAYAKKVVPGVLTSFPADRSE